MTRLVDVAVVLLAVGWLLLTGVGAAFPALGGPLYRLQAVPALRLASGLVLLAVVGGLWFQARARAAAGPAGAARWQPLHRVLGLVSVVALLAHSAELGFGWLGGLAVVLVGNALLGAVGPSGLRWVRAPRLWVGLHVALAVLLTGGIALHLWINLAYR